MRGDKWSDQRPRHPVGVKPFWCQTTAATVAQFGGLFDPAALMDDWGGFWEHAQEPDCPMIMVNFFDSFCFALWTDAQLLTESQWEFAVRRS